MRVRTWMSRLITREIQIDDQRSAMSYSCEKGRSSAYSEDLRWRMVWQKEALGKSLTEVSKDLCVDRSTVSRTMSLFFASGSVKKKP